MSSGGLYLLVLSFVQAVSVGLASCQHDVGMAGAANEPLIWLGCLPFAPLVPCNLDSLRRGKELISKFRMLSCDFLKPFYGVDEVLVLGLVCIGLQGVVFFFSGR